MANMSLVLYTNGFFGSVLKSFNQMGSLSKNNSVTNISHLGTSKVTNGFLRIFCKPDSFSIKTRGKQLPVI